MGEDIEARLDPIDLSKSQFVQDDLLAIRNAGKLLLRVIERSAPAGRAQSLAFTAVQEAVMWANRAVAEGVRDAYPSEAEGA